MPEASSHSHSKPDAGETNEHEFDSDTTVTPETDPDYEYTVDQVLAYRQFQGLDQYLISWVDYALAEATWEPFEHASNELRPCCLSIKNDTIAGKPLKFDVFEWHRAHLLFWEAKLRRAKRRNEKRLPAERSDTEDRYRQVYLEVKAAYDEALSQRQEEKQQMEARKAKAAAEAAVKQSRDVRNGSGIFVSNGADFLPIQISDSDSDVPLGLRLPQNPKRKALLSRVTNQAKNLSYAPSPSVKQEEDLDEDDVPLVSTKKRVKSPGRKSDTVSTKCSVSLAMILFPPDDPLDADSAIPNTQPEKTCHVVRSIDESDHPPVPGTPTVSYSPPTLSITASAKVPPSSANHIQPARNIDSDHPPVKTHRTMKLPKVLTRSVPHEAMTARKSNPTSHASATTPTSASSKAAGNIFTSGRLPFKRRKSNSALPTGTNASENEDAETPLPESSLRGPASKSSRDRQMVRIIMKPRTRERIPTEQLKVFDISQLTNDNFEDNVQAEVVGNAPMPVAHPVVNIQEEPVPLESEKMVRFVTETESWDCESDTVTKTVTGDVQRRLLHPRHREVGPERPCLKEPDIDMDMAPSPIDDSAFVDIAKPIAFVKTDKPDIGAVPQPAIGRVKAINVTFSNVSAHAIPQWFEVFKAAPGLNFGFHCSSKALEDQFHYARLGSSNLSAGSVTSENPEALQNVAKHLRVGAFCVLSFQAKYCVVIYPTHCMRWSSPTFGLSETTHVEGAALGYFIFETDNECLPQADLPYNPVSDPGFRSRAVVYKQLFGFDYQYLLPYSLKTEQTCSTSGTFFLLFPSSKHAMLSILGHWLRDCDPRCRILTSVQPGQFDMFKKEVKQGTIIIHESCLPLIRLMPTFYALLLRRENSDINLYSFNDGSSPIPLVPTIIQPGIVSSPARLGFHPILQTGWAVLVTPSFVVGRPDRFHNLLLWMKDCLEEYDSCCRVIIFSGISQLLLGLACAPEVKEQTRRLHFRNWEFLLELLDEHSQTSVSKTVCEDDRIIISPRIIHWLDEQSLVNWFGFWTIGNLDRHRHFYVLATAITEMVNKKSSFNVKAPIKFSVFSTSNPDKAYDMVRIMDFGVPERQDDDGSQALEGHPTSAKPDRKLVQSNIIRSDKPYYIHKYLQSVTPDAKDSVVVLYTKPVGYTSIAMAEELGDPILDFWVTYSGWWSYLRPFNWITYKRAYAGTFYTPDYSIEGGPKDQYCRRNAWIGVYRPTDPKHFEPCAANPETNYELLIFDPDAHLMAGRSLSVQDLKPMQREWIKFIKDNTGEKNTGSKIAKVWLTGFTMPQKYREQPLDGVLYAVQDMMKETFEIMPSSAEDLTAAGYVSVSLVEPMNDGPKIKSLVPSDDGTEYVIMQPPPVLLPRATGAKANLEEYHNLFFDAAMDAMLDDQQMLKYNLPTTQMWYKMQRKDRDFGHIMILGWGEVFESLSIPSK